MFNDKIIFNEDGNLTRNSSINILRTPILIKSFVSFDYFIILLNLLNAKLMKFIPISHLHISHLPQSKHELLKVSY